MNAIKTMQACLTFATAHDDRCISPSYNKLIPSKALATPRIHESLRKQCGILTEDRQAAVDDKNAMNHVQRYRNEYRGAFIRAGMRTTTRQDQIPILAQNGGYLHTEVRLECRFAPTK
jgi:hypothetical protein